jgi:hypothetical protein
VEERRGEEDESKAQLNPHARLFVGSKSRKKAYEHPIIIPELIVVLAMAAVLFIINPFGQNVSTKKRQSVPLAPSGQSQ